jgi:oligopeptide transport system permease protein
MAAFVVRRLLWTIPILWVVVTIVFFMMRSIGGDPFRRGPLPNFFVATLLVYYLAVKLHVLPTSGWTDGWTNKVLPSFTLGLLPMAYCVRLLRASLLETLELDYVRMARAKGLSARRVVVGHALRNSLLPLVTVLGPLLGYLVTGTFVIEYIFAVPGIARFYVASVLARDYTVVLALTVLLAVLIILANLAVDILHRVLDPRLRDADAAYARA